jgi:cobalt-zinc-cadmium efflux system outer membrane protein
MRTLGYELFAAQEKALAAREVADRLQALREVLVQRDATGLTPLLETRVIEATELTMQRKATSAELNTQSALLELNQLRGAPPESQLIVNQTQLHFRSPPPTTDLVAAARTNNFELRVRSGGTGAARLSRGTGEERKISRDFRRPHLHRGECV